MLSLNLFYEYIPAVRRVNLGSGPACIKLLRTTPKNALKREIRSKKIKFLAECEKPKTQLFSDLLLLTAECKSNL